MLMNQRGVTLTESMIAIAITGILLAIALPSYSTWIQNGRIKTSATSILNALQLARASAAANNSPVSFSISNGDWSVDLAADPDYGVAGKNIQKRFSTEGSSGTTVIPPQILITFNGAGRITPTPITPITFAVSGAESCTTARCMNVMVLPSGAIRMCDPAIRLSVNPQGC